MMLIDHWINDPPEMITLYLLKCENGVFYPGITGNFARRMVQHFKGKGGKTTKINKPISVAFTLELRDLDPLRLIQAAMIIEGCFHKLVKFLKSEEIEDFIAVSPTSKDILEKSIPYITKKKVKDTVLAILHDQPVSNSWGIPKGRGLSKLSNEVTTHG